MVPCFLMPPWLEWTGWFTPNAGVIETYQTALGKGFAAAAPALPVLTAPDLAKLGLALGLAGRRIV